MNDPNLPTLSSEFVIALYAGYFKWELDAHTLSVQAASKEGPYLRVLTIVSRKYAPLLEP